MGKIDIRRILPILSAVGLLCSSGCRSDNAPKVGKGLTLQQAAILSGKPEEPDLIWEAIQQSATPEYSGQDAMLRAVYNGRADVVTVLLDGRVKPRRDVAVSAVQTAASFGHTRILELLLKHDFPIDSTSYDVWGSALTSASSGNHLDCIRLLLDAGVDINQKAPIKTEVFQRSIPAIIEARHFKGSTEELTPLMAAALMGREDAVSFLLVRGADTGIKSSSGYTASDLASIAKRTETRKTIDRYMTRTAR